jgi:hypothetical protein
MKAESLSKRHSGLTPFLFEWHSNGRMRYTTSKMNPMRTIGLTFLLAGATAASTLTSATLPPLRVSENQRFLVTSDGRPFLTRIPDDSVIVTDRIPTSVPGAGRYRFVATRDLDWVLVLDDAARQRPPPGQPAQ